MEQEAVLAIAQLLRHDNSRVGTRGLLPLLMEQGEIANVEGDNGPAFRGGKGKLFLIGRSILPGRLRRQNIITAVVQVGRKADCNMAIEVEANEEGFKAG